MAHGQSGIGIYKSQEIESEIKWRKKLHAHILHVHLEYMNSSLIQYYYELIRFLLVCD